MITVGIVAEFNPFHMGHKYIIDYAKNTLNADNIIIIMSGDFVQRGTLASYSKWYRTKMALCNGADLVIELPTRYATSSAPFFSYAAVSCLDAIKGVDYLLFGCERDSVNEVKSIIDSSNKDFVEEGKTSDDPKDIDKKLSSNAILAKAYVEALNQLNSDIKPVVLELKEELPSASVIRDELNYNPKALTKAMPKEALECIKDIKPASDKMLDMVLYYALKESLATENNTESLNNNEDLTCYLEVSKEISDRIKSHINEYASFNDFVTLIKHKNIAYSRVKRALLHILLKHRKSAVEMSGNFDVESLVNISYLRLLGLKKEKSFLLKETEIPVISKVSDWVNLSGEKAEKNNILSSLKEDIFAADIYDKLSFLNGNPKLNEMKNSPVIF
ncbi:MAG: nucleotidyltransferase family protein [Lachnospiraceae bacterium]|nr:nucleotidyltransferase family protein [Lachnospiraceae bacterium]